MKAAISLTLHDVFPDEELQEIDYYIQGISKQKLIEAAVFLIYISDASSDFKFDWKNLLYNFWFSASERDLATDIYLRIKTLESQSIPGRDDIKYKYVFLNQITALRLLDYIVKQNDTPLEYGNTDLTTRNIMLFKLILRLNTEFNLNVDVKYSSNDNYTNDYLTRLYLPLSMAQYEVYNSSHFRLLHNYTMQQIKSLYLFEFLENEKPQLVRSFLEKYNCQSIKEYFNFYIIIIRTLFQRAANRDNKKYREPSSFFYESTDEKAIYFTDKFLINQNYSTEEELDFKYLRASPLVKYSNGHYAIISEVFTIQKIYNGLYFELKDIYEDEPENRKSNFRSYFTTNFSESFLLYKALRSIYQKRGYIQFSGDEIKENFLKENGPDYYIRNGNKIFLFENKDNFVSPKAKMSYNFTKIIDDINKKLVTEGKGIPQLIKNIKYILDKSYKFDTYYNSKTCKIYPIIITHRSEFDASGLNKYLNERFSEALNILKKEDYDVTGIQPLTLINIDILLLNQYLLATKRLSLDDLIDGYHKFMSNTKIHATSKEDFDTKVHEIYYSFSDYMLYIYARQHNLSYKDEMLKWARNYFRDAIFS